MDFGWVGRFVCGWVMGGWKGEWMGFVWGGWGLFGCLGGSLGGWVLGGGMRCGE